MTTRTAVVAEARALLGVRFRHQGRDAQHGLDCLGLLMIAAERAGVRLAGMAPAALDRQDYTSRPDAVALEAQLAQWLVRVDAPEPGDVLLLNIQGEAQHLALVSDYPVTGQVGMIHAYAPARQVVEHRYDAAWQAATRGVFRLEFPA